MPLSIKIFIFVVGIVCWFFLIREFINAPMMEDDFEIKKIVKKRKIESTNRDRRILFRITQAERNIKNRNLRKKYPSIERDTIKR